MTETINIDFFDNSITPIIEAVKNDNTREFQVFFDTNMDSFSRCKMYGKLPHGEKVETYGAKKTIDIPPVGDVEYYSFSVGDNFTAQVGDVELQFCFYTDNNEQERISSFPFKMKVYERGE